MKLVRLSSWGMCAVALALLVITLTRSRASRSLTAPFEGRAIASTQPVNSEEWTEIGKWVRSNNCARRYDFINRMPPGPVKGHAQQLIAERYRIIKRVNDPDLRNALVAEVQAQDQIFALQLEHRRKRERPIAEMKAAVEKLIGARAARLQAEAQLLLKRKNDPQFIDRQARFYFKNAEPRQLRSPGERGAENSDESSDADVAQ